jgi:hypothetical protein
MPPLSGTGTARDGRAPLPSGAEGRGPHPGLDSPFGNMRTFTTAARPPNSPRCTLATRPGRPRPSQGDRARRTPGRAPSPRAVQKTPSGAAGCASPYLWARGPLPLAGRIGRGGRRIKGQVAVISRSGCDYCQSPNRSRCIAWAAGLSDVRQLVPAGDSDPVDPRPRRQRPHRQCPHRRTTRPERDEVGPFQAAPARAKEVRGLFGGRLSTRGVHNRRLYLVGAASRYGCSGRPPPTVGGAVLGL